VKQPAGHGPRQLIVRLIVVAVTWLACAVVLWARQSSEALLAVSSFAGAVGEVGVFLGPSAAIYLLLQRSWPGTVVWGLLIAGLNLPMWWSVATDRHSTASLGPGLLDWALLPVSIVLFTIAALLWRTRDDTFGFRRGTAGG
jgi:hypothetical protein